MVEIVMGQTSVISEKQLRRRFRKIDLAPEEQTFLRVLATLGLAAWSFIIYSHAFSPAPPAAHQERPIEVANVLIKPPPPPEEKKEEPKPVPLPPRKENEKASPAPAKKPAPKVVIARAAPPAPKPEAPKRSVATLGLLSMLSSADPRMDSPSQRIGESLRNVDFRQARDLTEDIGSLTGSVGARDKATVGEMVAGLGRGTGTRVALQGQVVTPISGPGGGGASAESATGGGRSGRSIAEIREVVAQYIAGLKYLYDRELKQRPSLHGKVTVEFVVTPPGDVREVRLVSSALGHPGLESAILGRINGWKFPSKPSDSTRVTFPFDFVAPAG
ncbi:MAG: TonB family protein [Candidatus Binatia bacterium]